ncbi:flagellar hook protein FlgE [Sporanaerobacter acetigenes]|uniref:flagellar hook protein FlgE n=1 Tax=Sporanaerobacter acetigenes TaxID=165813 RepID=UPI0010478B06|nr:flagellar hook protein FlgE [Sporanaerobacter acetigenes]
MMRSMYSAVSGLRVHQTKMDVIGNNIANVNTVGYKKGQMTFQEVFSQVIRGAGAPQGGKGGTNPQQIGLGVGIGSINTIHTKGPTQTTDNPTDLMIDGEGFFVVTDDTNYENKYYTRAGNFTLDKAGNLVTPDGFKVLGYKVDENENITDEIGPIVINRSETKAPTATNKIQFRGNLDSRNDETFTTDTVIKDSLGNSYLVKFEFKKTGTETAPNKWTMSLGEIKSEDGKIEIKGAKLGDNTTIKFDENGKIIGIGAEDAINGLKLDFSEIENKEKLGATFGDSGKITIFDPADKDSYNKLTQYANDRDIKPYAENGNSSGKIKGFSIDPSGVVSGIFTNGERKALGQVMLAKFDNPMGLQKLGNNFFVDTRNSGEAQLGKPGTSGFGATKSGSLEMSNVDLSMEFTEMITTQRGFQANSRIITASDEMLQELVNMKR